MTNADLLIIEVLIDQLATLIYSSKRSHLKMKQMEKIDQIYHWIKTIKEGKTNE